MRLTWPLLLAVLSALAPPHFAPVSAQVIAPEPFVETPVLQDLETPTMLKHAPDGKVFVSLKSGILLCYPQGLPSDPKTPGTPVFDFSDRVFNWWDRGLLSFALHPDFLNKPYVFLLYSADMSIGGTYPAWKDECTLNDRCTGSGVLSRVRINLATCRIDGDEEVLINDWCTTSPSHHTGDIAFGPEGALYLAVGDCSQFDFLDYGQSRDTCNVHMLKNEPRGAFRSQVPRVLQGKLLRVDPMTGNAWPTNAAVTKPAGAFIPDGIDPRVIALGLRNPFRLTIDPANGDLYIGDVGWADWEEMNRLPGENVNKVVQNFGWPCYEGNLRSPGYGGLNYPICNALYARGDFSATQTGGHVKPFYTYNHNDANFLDSPVGSGGSAMAGAVVYRSTQFPAKYRGALFAADFARAVLFVFLPDEQGKISADRRMVFRPDATNICFVGLSPDGALYWISVFGGAVYRINFFGTEQKAPKAVLTIAPAKLAATVPTTFTLDASKSLLGDAPAPDKLKFEWDVGRGFEAELGATSSINFAINKAGVYRVRVRVTAVASGLLSTAEDTLIAGVTYSVVILKPSPETPSFTPGDNIEFQGYAMEKVSDTRMAPETLSWSVIIQHCHEVVAAECLANGTMTAPVIDCHQHQLITYKGIEQGVVSAPTHEYPSWLTITLRASIPNGDGKSFTEIEKSVDYYPKVSVIQVLSDPPDLKIIIANKVCLTPCSQAVMLNSLNSVSAPKYQRNGAVPQGAPNDGYAFAYWADLGNNNGADNEDTRVRQVTTTQQTVTFTVVFAKVTLPDGFKDDLVPEPRPITVCLPTTYGGDYFSSSNMYTATESVAQTAAEPTAAEPTGEPTEAVPVTSVAFPESTNVAEPSASDTGVVKVEGSSVAPSSKPTAGSKGKSDGALPLPWKAAVYALACLVAALVFA